MLNTDSVISTKTYKKKKPIFVYCTSLSPSSGAYEKPYFRLLKDVLPDNKLFFLHMVSLFYSRLLARGLKSDSLKQLVLEVIQVIEGHSNPMVFNGNGFERR